MTLSYIDMFERMVRRHVVDRFVREEIGEDLDVETLFASYRLDVAHGAAAVRDVTYERYKFSLNFSDHLTHESISIENDGRFVATLFRITAGGWRLRWQGSDAPSLANARHALEVIRNLARHDWQVRNMTPA